MKAKYLAALACVALSGSAGAAEFAMMETAQRINQGTFKLSGFPVVVDREDTGRTETGFTLGLGYGLPHDLDVEVQVSGSDEGTFVGSDLEWNAWRANRMAFSVSGGAHGGDLEGPGRAVGLDGTLIFSFNPMQRLALSAAFDAAWDDVTDRNGAVPADARFPADGDYERYYAVPGVSFLLTPTIDLLGEIGFGLNGDSDDYASAGVSWYFSRDTLR